MSRPIIVFLHDARYDRVFQAVGLVATAARMGRPTILCLFYDALATFVQGTWDNVGATLTADASSPWRATLARAFELADAPSLYATLEASRRAGTRVFACSTSVRYLDLDAATVGARVDAIAGLATMLEAAGDDAQIIYI